MATHFGRYELQEELGRGAMSIIYRGLDPRIGRQVALKTLRPEFSAHAEYRQRFVLEARAAGTLSHPHIVTIYDVGEIDGLPYIAMELLDGLDLEQFVREQGGRIGLPMLMKMAIQIAEALDFAHRRGIVHQDIKPENIAITSLQGDLKVMDFGIARIISQDELEEGKQTSAYLSGTPQYMSPEQITDSSIDGRSDLYSFGVMLYELISGKPPYQDDDHWSLWRRVLSDPLPRLKPLDRNAPSELIELVTMLLAKKPEERYQSAAGVLAELRTIQQHMVEQTRNSWSRHIVPIRLRWSLLMALLMTVVMVLGLFLVSERQGRAIENLAFDYGFSLSDWVATQTAEDLLLQDRIALQSWVESMSHNREIVYMEIEGADGHVLAKSEGAKISGLMAAQLNAKHVINARGDQRVYQVQDASGAMFDVFEMPIAYQGHSIGRLRIGLTTDSLVSANRTTFVALLFWIVGILITVVAGTYWLGRRVQTPLQVLDNALDQIKEGHLEHRIPQHRRDEFEQTFASFNTMADALQARAFQVQAEREALRPHHRKAESAYSSRRRSGTVQLDKETAEEVKSERQPD